jgi:hypothetical protein
LPTLTCFAAGDELLHEGLVELLLHQEARGRDADLPGVAELGARERLGGQVEVGVVEDDGRRVPAQLHRHALHVRAGERGELLAHRRGTGEGHLADDRVRDEVVADLGRYPVDERDDVPGTPASRKARTSSAGEAGVSSGALMMMEQPVATAAESLRTTWLIGKFHGVKAATGPTGSG